MSHPDELLSSFVDGSASPDEARSVESHLASCSQCRRDVAFSRAGRAALVGLPELEEPGIARAALPGLLADADKGTKPPIYLEERRGRGKIWEQVAWAAAVAAVVAGIIGAVVYISRQKPTSLASEPKVAAEATLPSTSLSPTVVSNGVEYSPDSLTALARRLASEPRNPAPAASAFAPAVPLPQSYGAGDQVDPAGIAACLRTGSGLGADAVPTYLELATFQATPAYVGVFPSDAGGPHLLLIVVSVDGCHPLYVVSQSL